MVHLPPFIHVIHVIKLYAIYNYIIILMYKILDKLLLLQKKKNEK